MPRQADVQHPVFLALPPAFRTGQQRIARSSMGTTLPTSKQCVCRRDVFAVPVPLAIPGKTIDDGSIKVNADYFTKSFHLKLTRTKRNASDLILTFEFTKDLADLTALQEIFNPLPEPRQPGVQPGNPRPPEASRPLETPLPGSRAEKSKLPPLRQESEKKSQ